MPFHLLDFLSLDHHQQHFHDDTHASHHGNTCADMHDGVAVSHHHNHIQSLEHNRPSAASFLSSTDIPVRRRANRFVSVDNDSPTSWLAHSASAASLRVQQAASFLDTGLIDTSFAGDASSHASASSFLSVQKSLTELVHTTPPAALVPLHALSIVGAVPGHVAFELGEGFLFGFQKGFALALTGKLLGSAAAFCIGRSALTCGCLKDRLQEHMNRWPLCQKVAGGVEKGGGLSVFVIRMAPVPCVVKNYSLALLTDIPFSTYLIASFAGLVPTTAAHVYAGTLAPSAVALASGTAHLSGTQAATLASPVVAGISLTMFAGYYLHQHVLSDIDEKDDVQDENCKLEKNALDSIDKCKQA